MSQNNREFAVLVFCSVALQVLLAAGLYSAGRQVGFGEGYIQCVAERPTTDMEPTE